MKHKIKKYKYELSSENPKILYLGLNKKTAKKYHAYHLPILQLVPFAQTSPQLKKAFRYLPLTTHILLTSPSSSALFLSKACKRFSRSLLQKKCFICIGKATHETTRNVLPKASTLLASEEISEGVFPVIRTLPKTSYLLYPHSALSRPSIKDFLTENSWHFFSYAHYTVKPRPVNKTLFSQYEHVILTSPSTVRAYAQLFPQLPKKTYWCQGPITLQEFQNFYCAKPQLLNHWALEMAQNVSLV
ncbi:uroporphyrinogen-III synthase [Chlamydia pecorum]|uniref:uroporphyrinogen-III synthase n=1 Tax=Chlamydia pecorum TaxID=85991 RepID=UPI0007AF7603|nr:uroporphyrinogen-III synthase [Chlamydia pecorum]KZN28349.1 uroporphyrinogen-III synthase HemD family protein [Chlamydia pecorum]